MPASESLSRTLPGEPGSVAEARRLLRRFLADHHRADDAELILSELATNAVRHSRSRAAGAVFEVRVQLKPGLLRIEVVDQGAPTRSAPAGEPDESFGPRESGRGLLIVEALADDWGHEQHQSRAMWWAELGRGESVDA